jgi:hypothetical protein
VGLPHPVETRYPGTKTIYKTKSFRWQYSDTRLSCLQVLVATSVLAEGIDVPECSLVVALDRIVSPTVFTQVNRGSTAYSIAMHHMANRFLMHSY